MCRRNRLHLGCWKHKQLFLLTKERTQKICIKCVIPRNAISVFSQFLCCLFTLTNSLLSPSVIAYISHININNIYNVSKHDNPHMMMSSLSDRKNTSANAFSVRSAVFIFIYCSLMSAIQ